jgi:SH3-like domain-containing protein
MFQLRKIELASRQGTDLMELGRFCSALLFAECLLGVFPSAASAKDAATTSGLPIPRYVSLKSDHVNVRAGPTKDNDVAWVYTRSGLPVEITAEFENWRRVRDSEGAEGWVYHSLLSGRRTAVITMKSREDLAPLYERADRASAVTARLQAGVITQVRQCESGWCRVSGNGFDGWIEQQRLWGVYADEKVN